ncbi:MAG TPA: hypothetical protein VM782_12015, partial [Stellaceae bacterium]|nr:hypothetical protein [Stellaceae bacterium]
MNGGRLLRQVFREAQYQTADRDAVLIGADEPAPPSFLIHRGVAFRATTLPDGRRAIIDILLPGDVGGIDRAVLGRSNYELVAACPLGYRALPAATIRELLRNPQIALHALALMGEMRWRADRHITAIARLDARSRIASF